MNICMHVYLVCIYVCTNMYACVCLCIFVCLSPCMMYACFCNDVNMYDM